jgi:hypothetical protein
MGHHNGTISNLIPPEKIQDLTPMRLCKVSEFILIDISVLSIKLNHMDWTDPLILDTKLKKVRIMTSGKSHKGHSGVR